MKSYKVNIEKLEALDKEILKLKKLLELLDKLEQDRDEVLKEIAEK